MSAVKRIKYALLRRYVQIDGNIKMNFVDKDLCVRAFYRRENGNAQRKFNKQQIRL